MSFPLCASTLLFLGVLTLTFYFALCLYHFCLSVLCSTCFPVDPFLLVLFHYSVSFFSPHIYIQTLESKHLQSNPRSLILPVLKFSQVFILILPSFYPVFAWISHHLPSLSCTPFLSINECLVTQEPTDDAEFGLLGEEGILGKEMTADGHSY